MPTTALNPQLTAKAFLFENAEGHDAVEVISRAVKRNGLARSALSGFRHLSGSTVRAVGDQIGAVADDLLEVDLGDALVMGWRKYSALVDSAKRTSAAPGTQEVVGLASHTVTWSYQPHVDLLVDSVKVNSFEFDLTAAFELTGVTAAVKNGNLAAIRSGECVVSASLALEGAALARRKRALDLGFVLDLRRPVPLLGSHAAPGVPRQASVPAAEVIVEGKPDGAQEIHEVRTSPAPENGPVEPEVRTANARDAVVTSPEDGRGGEATAMERRQIR